MSKLALAPLPVLAVIATLGVWTAHGPTAFAKPEFAKKEGKDCAFCHVNPRGGGPRNDKGNEYQKNGFKFPVEKKGYGEDGAFSTESAGKAFARVRDAIGLTFWSDALRRIAEIKPKEKKGTKGADLLLNTETSIDARGKDLVVVAKDAVQGGKVAEAAEALARLETEFKGRDPAKDVAKWRTELEKLPGGKEAGALAKIQEAQRLQWFAAQTKLLDGDKAGAIKLAEDLVAKFPDGPFFAAATAKLAEWKGAPAAPAMGG